MSRTRINPAMRLVQLESRDTPTLWVTNFSWSATDVGSLPYAVDKANNIPGRDDIQFDFVALGTNNPVFNSGATLQVTDEVTITGWAAVGSGKSVTIGGTKPFVFSMQATNKVGDPENPGTSPPPSSTVNGMRFVSCTGSNGGAIEVAAGDLVVSNCYFAENTAVVGGGAISVGPASQLTVNGYSLLQQNQASYGGAILNNGRLVLTGGAFDGNKAVTQPGFAALVLLGGPAMGLLAGYGGAINSTGLVTVEGDDPLTLIKNNYAAKAGGGVYLNTPSTDWNVFTGGRFEYNSVGKDGQGVVDSGDGGGIRIAQGKVRITGTEFYGNSAGSGGGLSVGSSGSAEIKSAKFEYNTALSENGSFKGRAIDIEAGNNTRVTIQGTTFESNGIQGIWVDNGTNIFNNSPNE